MNVVWTKTALADLDKAHAHVAESGSSAAKGFGERIERSLAALEKHPEIGRKGRVHGTRELVVPKTPFILVYSLLPKQIAIVAFLHAARKWPDE